MNKLLFIGLAVITVISCSQSKQTNFHWLSGEWLIKDSGNCASEKWSFDEKEVYSGVSTSGPSVDSLKPFEVVTIKKNTEGKFVYQVQSSTNKQEPPVDFVINASTDSSFIAENPQHDYPKRIGYNLITKDSIVAFIDNGKDSVDSRMFFHYRKVN